VWREVGAKAEPASRGGRFGVGNTMSSPERRKQKQIEDNERWARQEAEQRLANSKRERLIENIQEQINTGKTAEMLADMLLNPESFVEINSYVK
jgi:hypothetical protein